MQLNGQNNVIAPEPEQLSPLAEAQRTLASLDEAPAPMQLSPDNETPPAPVVEVVDNTPANQESPGEESRDEFGIRARALYDYQAGKSILI